MPIGLAVRRGRPLGERHHLDPPDRRREHVDEGQGRSGKPLDVSCPSVSLCVAVDSDGKYRHLDRSDRRRERGGGQDPGRPQYGLQAVSCPSVSLCVAGGSNILSSTNPTGGAHTWTPALVVPGCAPESFPCISEQLYAHDDLGTRVVDTAPPGQGNSIANVGLSVDSVVLSWTHDGAQRQLQLR